MRRVYNFSAGPATLPLEVLQEAKEELLDWHHLGMSVMEIGHRSKDFIAVAQAADADLRSLLSIPANYEILFLQGGGRSQFAMVPLNLLGTKKTANYLDTGIWSTLALLEAKRYCEVNCVASSREADYMEIPPQKEWVIDTAGAYFHYVDNETITGVEFKSIPAIPKEMPLVSDMSSNFLSRPIDISKFSLIYAGAQKNIAPAGLTLVIIRNNLLGKALPFTPSMFDYALHAKERSLYNTPPTFAWYMAGLTFKWLKQQGGIAKMAEINEHKSQKLYTFIDANDFYVNSVKPSDRSRMNVSFRLTDESLTDQFLQEANHHGLANLKGHKLIGGMRASLYNAMPEEGVDALVTFMKDFSTRYG